MASLDNATGWAPEDMGNYDPFIRKELRAGVSSITTFSYYKSVVYYPRIMAYFNRNSILCSSGDSPIRFHRFFRGRDSMNGNGESPLPFLGSRVAAEWAPLLAAVTTSRWFITQELWRIPAENVCSLQAAIFQKRFHRFFRGRDSMKGNMENRR
jgi:hypothetical protein